MYPLQSDKILPNKIANPGDDTRVSSIGKLISWNNIRILEDTVQIFQTNNFGKKGKYKHIIAAIP